MSVHESVIVHIGYRDVRRGTIAQRDERGVNSFFEQNLVAKANNGSIACHSVGKANELLQHLGELRRGFGDTEMKEERTVEVW